MAVRSLYGLYGCEELVWLQQVGCWKMYMCSLESSTNNRMGLEWVWNNNATLSFYLNLFTSVVH